ncbi:MAG: hypothetical protein ACP5TY_05495 [Thermodesulforhabdaceae bacterium]
MIAGIIGIFVAFLIFVCIILFAKPKPDPTIAVPLNNFLTQQGFVPVDQSDSVFNEISNALRSTAHNSLIVQMYRRYSDDIVVCWVSNSNGHNNNLVAVAPQTVQTEPWIMLSLPSIKGMGANFIRKFFELSGLKSNRSVFSKVEPSITGQSIDLYIPKGGGIPSLNSELINLIPRLGNIILRSTGNKLLVERISINREETWEQGARELIRITQLVRGYL